MAAFQNGVLTEAKTGLVPVGGLVAHGPHLPLGTDTLISTALAEGVEAMFPDRVLLLPPFSYGHSWEMARFSGTLSVSTRLLADFMTGIGLAAAGWGIRYLVFVNGQAGNAGGLVEAAERITERGPAVMVFNWWEALSEDSGRGRGGEAETAMALALAPDLVATRSAPENPRRMRHPGVYDEAMLAEAFRHGMSGDARRADPATGRRLVEEVRTNLAARIRDLWDGRLLDLQGKE